MSPPMAGLLLMFPSRPMNETRQWVARCRVPGARSQDIEEHPETEDRMAKSSERLVPRPIDIHTKRKRPIVEGKGKGSLPYLGVKWKLLRRISEASKMGPKVREGHTLTHSLTHLQQRQECYSPCEGGTRSGNGSRLASRSRRLCLPRYLSERGRWAVTGRRGGCSALEMLNQVQSGSLPTVQGPPQTCHLAHPVCQGPSRNQSKPIQATWSVFSPARIWQVISGGKKT